MKDITKPLSVRLNLDYPNLNDIEKTNNVNSKRLMNDLAGYVSELTAILQYIYQSQILLDKYPNISKTIMDIAQIEMHHYMIIGETITRLGGNPQAKNWKGCPWNGTYPNYNNTLINLLKEDIESEEQAIEQYKYHILMVKQPVIINLLKRIIIDEENHIKIFKEIIKEVTK